MTNEWALPQEKFWQSCSVHFSSRFHATETGHCMFADRNSSCLVFICHMICRVRFLYPLSIESFHPQQQLKTQVSMHQTYTGLFSFIARSGCHTNNCTKLLLGHSLSLVLLAQYFRCPLLLQSVHHHQQLC